jgi:hypothetical protein
MSEKTPQTGNTQTLKTPTAGQTSNKGGSAGGEKKG